MKKSMNNSVKSVLVLFLICAIVAALMAITNTVTDPYIKENERKALEAGLQKVMPGGEDFEKLDIASFELPSTVSEVYQEKNGGYCFKLVTTGYSTGMQILCGIRDGQVTGATCLGSSETLGYEKTYGDSLVGKTADTLVKVDTVAGATRTTSGYKNAVSDAFTALAVLTGKGA